MSRRPRAQRAGAPFAFRGRGAGGAVAWLALAASALGLAGLAAAADGNGAGTEAPAAAIAQSFGAPITLGASGLERVSGPERQRLRAASASERTTRGRSLELSYYVGVDFQDVQPGGAQLFEIRCPESAEQVVTGGIFAPLPGLVVVNSSRMNPQPGFPTHPRAWYEAVVNISGGSLQWKPFVTCGVRKRVEK